MVGGHLVLVAWCFEFGLSCSWVWNELGPVARVGLSYDVHVVLWFSFDFPLIN
jgi:hypothetical protein